MASVLVVRKGCWRGMEESRCFVWAHALLALRSRHGKVTKRNDTILSGKRVDDTRVALNPLLQTGGLIDISGVVPDTVITHDCCQEACDFQYLTTYARPRPFKLGCQVTFAIDNKTSTKIVHFRSMCTCFTSSNLYLSAFSTQPASMSGSTECLQGLGAPHGL